MKNFKLAGVALCLSITFTSWAQGPDNTEELPGNTKLPTSTEEFEKIAALEVGEYKYSVEDYFKRPETSSYQFSPDGKYFSYRKRDDKGKRHIYIQDIASGKSRKLLEEGEELIRGYGWPNNSQLIYVKDQGGDENYQLFTIPLEGGEEKALTPFDGVRVGILQILREIPDEIIIQMNKENAQVFEPYRLNIKSGEMVKLYENKDIANPISGYNFDKDGHLRGFTRQVNGLNYQLLYRTSEDKEFEVVTEYDWTGSFGIVGFDYSGENPHVAYVTSNLNTDKRVIARFDLENKKQLETVFEAPGYDAGGMSRSRKRNYEIDYYSYNGATQHIIPVSDTYKAFHKRLEDKFKGKQFFISAITEEEDKVLIYVTSDRLYGEYHVYDADSDKFKKLLDLMPQLEEGEMAEMRPIKYKTRDGLQVEGYITLPKEALAGKKVPMIVNPHGGPYGVRDSWGFNPESQLFASRGYATLQVNYRGSGGYGKKFYLAGSKQIGRNMLNDLEDGVAFAIDQGWIDKDKVAIYGASYGGLATLGSLVKTPDLYTCGVDYVGVSNLFTFVNSFPAYWKPYMKQFYAQWYDPENPEEKKIMEEVSPALNAEKITKPLMVVQGANDPRVNIDESDQVVENLRDRGYYVPYMVKYNEGHGFGHEENRLELYQSMMGFFAKYLKDEEQVKK